MISDNAMWVGFAAGCLCLGLVTVAWMRGKTAPVTPIQPAAKDSIADPKAAFAAEKENIRQIGLIQKDEFNAFYQPIIDKVGQYSAALGEPAVSPDYFKTLYKALRKRRSAIFEFGSSEADQTKRAAWTYALFASLSIRYIAALLSRFKFSNNGQAIEPTLVNINELRGLQTTQSGHVSTSHRANTLNLHLIDKVLPATMIRTLADNGIYPSLVNAVTGFYSQPLNPFYQIIEQVERHVRKTGDDDNNAFDYTLQLLLQAIARNIVSKNTAISAIFEGQYDLFIDRCVFWELFRSYSVAEAAPISKTEFEITLCKHLGISQQLSSTLSYTVLIDKGMLPDDEPVTLELRNVLALPYQKIPLYKATDRLGVSRHIIDRNLLVGDQDSEPSSELGVPVQAAAPSRSREVNQERVIETSNKESVVVGDLFSNLTMPKG